MSGSQGGKGLGRGNGAHLAARCEAFGHYGLVTRRLGPPRPRLDAHRAQLHKCLSVRPADALPMHRAAGLEEANILDMQL